VAELEERLAQKTAQAEAPELEAPEEQPRNPAAPQRIRPDRRRPRLVQRLRY